MFTDPDALLSNAPARCFRTTQWTVVLSAQAADSEEGFQALENLCRIYWYPLYGFARRKGASPEDAQDFVQGFFEKLLAKDYLREVRPEKGRFRTFLQTSFSNYLANEWDKRKTLKRGGAARIVSIDAELAENRFRLEPVDPSVTPDTAFDLCWANLVVERSIEKLRAEYVRIGEKDRFEVLSPCLAGESEECYTKFAAKLNLSEGGVKTAVRRMRLRFRSILLDELAETMSSGADVEEELRHLLRSVRR